MSKLFARLSTEEDDVLGGGTEGTNMEITEVVEAEATAVEVTEDVNEIEKDIAAMEDADEALVEINDQIATDEVKLENPETVTAADALVSQESLRMTAKMLGASLSDLGITTVSQESAKDSPVTALQLSVESAKEFFFKLIEQIKAIFSKIWNYLKKLAAKAYVWFVNIEKQASNMLEKLKDLNKTGAEDFDEDEQKKVVKLVGMPMLFTTDMKITGENLVKYVEGVGETNLISKSAETYEPIITDLEKIVSSDASIAPNNDLIPDTAKVAIDLVTKISNFVKKSNYRSGIVTHMTGNKKDKFTEVDNDTKVIIPFSIKGGSLTALYINMPATPVDKYETVRDVWNAMEVKKSTDKLDSTDSDSMAKGLKPLPHDDITKVLKQVKKNGSGMKKFVDDTLKSVESGSSGIKKLEAIAKKMGNITGEKSSGLVKVASLMRSTVSNLALAAIYDNVGGCKSALAVCAMSMKKYEKKD